MARKPHVNPNRLREARLLQQSAAPEVRSYPGVEEVRVSLTFVDPEGKQQPSPRGLTYAGDMHAFFDFTCPLRDCQGGGFDASADLLRALGRRRSGHSGHVNCRGTRPRNGIKNLPCNLELRYTMQIRGKSAAAA